jgi:phytoene dehydrogenase-like protein
MHEIRANQIPATPAFHAGVPTLHDPSQAPPGYHTAFAWQFVPSRPADGGKERWASQSESYADAIMAQWQAYAPNLAEAGVARYVHSPMHTEWHVPSMFHGDRHHGSYHPENFGYQRPHPTLSGYRTPIERLYLCGAGTHPGGSFTGYPGYNAAGVIARELGMDPWWQPHDVRAALAALE